MGYFNFLPAAPGSIVLAASQFLLFVFRWGLLEVFYFFHLLFLAMGSFVSLKRPGTGTRSRKVARPSLLFPGRTFPRSSGCGAVEGTCVHLQVCDKYQRKWCQFAKRNGNNNQFD